MYYHQDDAAEDSVVSKFGTMAHAIMPAVPSNGNSPTEVFQPSKHFVLVAMNSLYTGHSR